MKERGGRHPKAQSAMEYLMTYGWAILIIAVVLGALYSLGVFNAVNFMPKVPGGGCHVFRPNGPGTSWSVNLVGSCNNALPQYVARFNGQSSGISISTSAALQSTSSITISAWMKTSNTVQQTVISNYKSGDANSWTLFESGLHTWLEIRSSPGNVVTTGSAADGSWHNVIATSSPTGSSMAIYIDGVQKASIPAPIGSGANAETVSIGREGGVYYFNGSIANVQVYNTSLTANQVQYLYSEGIGGVPVSPQYLVGWWPLNGDTNDYSGNNNNGAAAAVTFNGTWTGGYTTP